MAIRNTLLAASILVLVARWASSGAKTRPKLDKSMQRILDTLKSLGGKPIEKLTPAEARMQPSPGAAVRAIMDKDGISITPDDVLTVTQRTIPGPLGDITLHVYTPEGTGPFPVLLYFHGGGFVIATTADYDASIRSLAKGADTIVVSVDYHQAPEHKFPAASNDAYAAYLWVRANAADLNADPAQVAIGGESAGGNLATVVSLMARDRNVPVPLHQLLIYPLVDDDMLRPSYIAHARARPLNQAMMKWFLRHYASKRDALNPYALPMKAASLKDLPPVTLITAEIDPLQSEGQAYAARLLASGVAVAHREYAGVTHEFFGMGAVLPAAREAQKFAADSLRLAFNRERFRLSRQNGRRGQSLAQGLP